MSAFPFILPSDLQEAQSTVITDAECSTVWGTNFGASVMCIFDPTFAVGSCFRDNGGPLVWTVSL